ncbi:MAG: class E sortase [Actinomycetota bacterium]|nr:class E sortase [Actinomycetota bacterium]
MSENTGRIAWRQIIGRLLIGAAFLMAAYYFGTNVYTFFVQKDLQTKWRRLTIAAARHDGKEAESTATAGDGMFGRLLIPKLGLDVIVLEGTDPATLTRGPGHIKTTAMPWEGANTAISGHRTTYGAPFARLDRLRHGDKIELLTTRGKFIYLVAGSVVVKPTDLSVIGQAFKNRLTLTTCDPPGSAARRLAVWAIRRLP